MLKEILIVFTFLTRIPLKINFTYGAEDMGKTSRYFPLVGLVIGLIVATVLYALNIIDHQLAAILALLTGVFLTGGLHLDGFIDTADGIFSARTRERILEIMKDSHVGAHGVTAVFVFLLLKFVLYGIIARNHLNVFWIIPMAFIFSRWMMVFSILFFPGARKDGLAHIFITYQRKWDFPLATILMVLPVLIFQEWITMIPIIMAFFIILYCCRSINNILGGLTGDVYGAVAELSEVVFIVTYLITEYFFLTIKI
ncbi:MAG: adenosylcobinamide-GDP ribazoletransferase [Dehalobacterium sp.]|jgi:adenosylcobinamide-GDP ribazoletransferase